VCDVLCRDRGPDGTAMTTVGVIFASGPKTAVFVVGWARQSGAAPRVEGRRYDVGFERVTGRGRDDMLRL